MARPPKVKCNADTITKMYRLAKEGKPNADIAAFVGVSLNVLGWWLKSKPEVKRIIERGRQEWEDSLKYDPEGLFKDVPDLTGEQRAFLQAFVLSGTVTHASQASGTSVTTHAYWKRKYPEYAKAYLLAEEMATDMLEREARRRAVEGVEQLKFYKGEPIMDPRTGEYYKEHAYSDNLLALLLKGRRPEVYKDRSHMEIEGEVDHTMQRINLDDLELPVEMQREILKAIRKQTTGSTGYLNQSDRVINGNGQLKAE